jgi:hypothetical protein
VRRLPLTPPQQKAVRERSGVCQGVLSKWLNNGECSVTTTLAIERAMDALGYVVPRYPKPGQVVDLIRRMS